MNRRIKRAEVSPADKLFVTAGTLAEMLECGRETAKNIGKAAGARVQFGGLVRYDIGIVREYLNSLPQAKNKQGASHV